MQHPIKPRKPTGVTGPPGSTAPATAEIEDANPFLTELLDYSHAELLGKKLWEVGAFADVAESLLVDNVPAVIEKMFALKAKGVCFSLDELKNDRSFVRDILSDHHDASIAKTILALAHSLCLNVIAEGVEIEAQRDFLSATGCHTYQGFYFCMPLPVAAFERYVRRAL